MASDQSIQSRMASDQSRLVLGYNGMH
jgi:hypothetical protein